MIGWY